MCISYASLCVHTWKDLRYRCVWTRCVSSFTYHHRPYLCVHSWKDLRYRCVWTRCVSIFTYHHRPYGGYVFSQHTRPFLTCLLFRSFYSSYSHPPFYSKKPTDRSLSSVRCLTEADGSHTPPVHSSLTGKKGRVVVDLPIGHSGERHLFLLMRSLNQAPPTYL